MISIDLYMCHHIKKSKVILLLEMKDVRMIKAQHPKNAGVTSWTTKGRPNPLKNKKNDLTTNKMAHYGVKGS
jgi:hypothetical protein